MTPGGLIAPEDWHDEDIVLVDYRDTWPEEFGSEAERLQEAIGPYVTGGIHHVGSTAIPGMTAKPIIDILVGVRDLDSSRGCRELLRPLDYWYAPYLPEVMHWFCKPSPASRTHHLHLIPTGSPRYLEEIAFVDYLHAHPETARDYAVLKRQLAQRFRTDREAYTDGKGEFVSEVTQRALAFRADPHRSDRPGSPAC